MPSRPIIAAAAFGPAGELSAGQRRQLHGQLSVLAARRLGPAALALHSIIPDNAFGSGDDVIFGSSMGSGCSLVSYLKSFPDPSPANFQSSVHAAVIEAVMVLRRATVARLQSFADAPTQLVATVFRSASLSTAATTHLVFAEEFSPWLSDEQLGSRNTVACWLQLGPPTAEGQPAAPATGILSWENSMANAAADAITLETMAQSIADRRAVAVGSTTLQWL